jgi:hypothetical protein
MEGKTETDYFNYFKFRLNSHMRMTVFWVVAPCSLVEVYRRFIGACSLHHQGDRPETSVNFYQTTRHNNPEDSHLHTHRRENLESHKETNESHLLSVRNFSSFYEGWNGVRWNWSHWAWRSEIDRRLENLRSHLFKSFGSSAVCGLSQSHTQFPYPSYLMSLSNLSK